MWKWIAGVTVGLVLVVAGLGFNLQDKIYPRQPHATVSPADFATLYTPARLRADFRYMTAMIEHIHPDIAAITDRQSYTARKTEILAQLDRPMTRVQFARIIDAINAEYRDGHTVAEVPAEEWRASRGLVVPLNVRIDTDRIVILRGLGGVGVPMGSELVSLNGWDGAGLAIAAAARVSGETADYRRGFAASRFAGLNWLLGIRPPYRIVYRVPGTVAVSTTVSSGVPFDVWSAAAGNPGADPYHLQFADGVAVLAMKDFDSLLYDRIHAFLPAAFQAIRDRKVKAVVLDMRQCDGGDTRLSDELQTYLSDDLLPAIDTVTVKATPEVKAMYRTLLPEGFRWIPLNQVIPQLAGIQNAPDNGFFASHPESAAPVRRGTPNPLAYHGDLYVLTDANTYSTCLIAAAPYKFWKRGVFIGEPSGEGLTFYGDYYEFDLPNTKLQARASHKVFKLVGSKGPNVPLMPDIAVDESHPDALAIALSQIARKRGAR